MTPTQISNLALSQIASGPITSFDESSLPARTCKLWYQQVLEELLEKGPWRFSLKRVALAELPGNDRSSRWLYAYAAPADALLVLKVLDATGYGSQQYDYAGAILYTNAPEAIIEYVPNGGTNLRTTAHFRAALIAQLAARVAMPITKNRKLAVDLQQAAETATARAQAANLNETEQTYGDFIPEVLKARIGESYDNRVLEGPEAVYPDFDPVGTFESELD